MSKQRYLRGLLVGVVGVLLLLGGVVTASNMGFKFVPNIAASSSFNLSLPWNNNYTKANELLNDLPGVVKVQKYTSSATLIDWFAGASPTANFAVAKGEAYIAVAGSGGSNTAVVVGSHDPNFTVSFNAGESFNAAAPYHQTFTKANELLNDLNGQMGAGAVNKVQKYTSSATLIDWFSGASPTANFSLDLGAGVIVVTGNGGSGYAWPHY